MAIGSRRTTPTAPVAAAVVSEAKVAPRNVPCCQLYDWKTTGTSFCRRAPKRIALIGTPCGFSHSGEYVGHCLSDTVKREFGCAAGLLLLGSHGLPRQSCAFFGGGSSCPS